MKTYVHTVMIYIRFGLTADNDFKKESSGFLTFGARPTSNVTVYVTDWEEFEKQNTWVQNYANYHQYEIKAIVPITTSLSEVQQSSVQHYSWAYGLGFSSIIGYTFYMQKKEELTDEEYEFRMASHALDFLKSEITPLENSYAELLGKQKNGKINDIFVHQIEKLQIVKRKQFLVGEQFDICYEENGKQIKLVTYDSIEESENFLNDCKNKLKAFNNEIETAKNKIENMKKKIADAEMLITKTN